MEVCGLLFGFSYFAAIPASWGLIVVVVILLVWPTLLSQPLRTGTTYAQTRMGFLGPLLAAAGIALLSIPVIAPSLRLFDTFDGVRQDTPNLPVDDIRRWLAVVGCAVPSVLVAAMLGAPAVRRHRVIGGVFTFLVALGVAIAALPFALTMLGPNLGAEVFCLDSCSAIIQSGSLASGLITDIFYAWAPLFEPTSLVTLAVGVILWTAIVRRFFTATS